MSKYLFFAMSSRFLPARYAMAFFKRGKIDIRSCWENERLYFLEKNINIALKMLLLRIYYFFSPVGFGVPWGCAMESSIRLINILRFLRNEKLEAAAPQWIRGIVMKEIGFVSNNLELHSFNNHYLFNVVSLAAAENAGYLQGEQWANECFLVLGKQFNADGSNFEGSTAYHFLVLELLCHYLSIAPNRRDFMIGAFNVKGALRFSRSCFYNDYDIWNVGDNDSGSIFYCNDKRLVRRAQYEFALEVLESIGPELSSIELYPDFGGALVRYSGLCFALWNVNVGQHGCGGHNHNDCLSVTLSLNGFPFLVDPGVYLYSSNRDDYRSSEVHSCLLIEGLEHERFLSAFRMSNSSKRSLSTCSDHGVFGMFEKDDFLATRSVRVSGDEIFIADSIRSSNGSYCKLIFVLAPSVRFSQCSVGLVLSRDGLELLLKFSDQDFELKDACYGYSDVYGEREFATSLCLTFPCERVDWSVSVI